MQLNVGDGRVVSRSSERSGHAGRRPDLDRAEPIAVMRFTPDAIKHEQSVDFFEGENIILHCKVRHSLGGSGRQAVLVANDWRGGAWGPEQALPLADQTSSAPIEVQLLKGQDGIVLAVDGSGHLLFKRLASLRDAQRLEHPPSILVIEAEQAVPAPAISPRKAVPGSSGPARSATDRDNYLGAVDGVTDTLITGWAYDLSRPDHPVSVDLIVDGRLVTRFTCDKHRADLKKVGLGEGNCSFFLPTPIELRDGKPHEMRLEITNLNLSLLRSPQTVTLEPAAAAASLPSLTLPIPTTVGQDGSSPALLALGALLRAEPSRLATLALDALDVAGLDLARPLDVSRFRTLDPEGCGGVLSFDDLSFVGGATLRCRITSPGPDGGTSPSQPPILRVLQPALPRSELLRIEEIRLSSEDVTFADLHLVNPFAPVLFVVFTSDGSLKGCSLLPFPSLCTGGAHAGELAWLGDAPSYLGKLRSVSDSLLRDALGWGGQAADLAVGLIEVDLEGSSGTDRIFSAGVRDWLAAVACIRAVPLSLPGSAPDPTRDYLEGALGAGGLPADRQDAVSLRESRGALRLRVPADALPSLSALFSRRLKVPPGDGAVSGPYVAADAVTGRPGWAVMVPPACADLAALQPRDVALPFPCLVPSGSRSGHVVAGGVHPIPLPLAIRFLAQPTNYDALALYPVAPDHGAPILKTELTASERRDATISAVLSSDLEPDALGILLRSLRLQTVADRLEVIALVKGNDRRRIEAVRTLVATSFPTGSKLLHQGEGCPSAAINEGVAEATGRYVLLIDEPVVLHDIRVLEVLSTMMLERRAASAGCVSVRTDGTQRTTSVRHHSGGLFLSHLSLTSLPRLVVTEPATPAAIPLSTYPVLGNSFRLALVRRAAWSELGGLRADTFPADHADLDFALRAVTAGYWHLCTSAVTVLLQGQARRREDMDPVAARFLDMPQWERLARSVTSLSALS